MTQPAYVNNSIEDRLAKVLFWGNYEEAVQLMEENGVSANSIIQDRGYASLIERVISGCSRHSSLGQNNHYPLAKYLLDNGADVTVINKDGYSALSLAAIEPKRIEYLELILQYPIANINSKEKAHGHTALLEFIKDVYNRLAPVSVSLKHRCLAITESFLKNGADPDIENKHGASARTILRHHINEFEALNQLFDKYSDSEKATVAVVPSLIPETLQYPDVAKEIWRTLVPKSGASTTVQGELLRVIEKLRDEAQRNGNINFRAMHKNMAQLIKATLLGSHHFDNVQKEEIGAYVAVISKKNSPYTDDDAFDYLTDRICEFYLKEPALIPYTTTED